MRSSRTPPSAAGWPEQAQRDLVSRIVVSPTFVRTERLSTLLTYICDMALKGREAEINEQKIGHAVFGRSPDYDSAVDGIVRTQASRLRQRLDQYFQHEGADEPVRIVIPRGGYVPVFEARAVAVALPEEKPIVSPPSNFETSTAPALTAAPTRSKAIWLLRGAALASLLILAGLLVLSLAADRGRLEERFLALIHPTPSQRLWRMLFVPGRPTILTLGDAGANMYENIARKRISADEYASDSWSKEPESQTPPGYNWVPIVRRTYTPIFGARFAARLASVPEVSDGQISVITARSLRLSELKDSQAILLGGVNYDPWEALLTANRNFRYLYDPQENSVSIYNEHPEAGEAAIYKWKQSDPNPVAAYSLITLTHNLSGNGRVFLLQGSTAQGDEAAADFVLDPSRFDPLLEKAIAGDGTINDFEAVLETRFVGGGNVGLTVAALRVHPSPATSRKPS